MDSISRSQHDCEIQRLQKLMAETDALSDEYDKLLKRMDILARTANEDDRIRLEADVEELKAQNESERLEDSREEKKKDFWIQVITPTIAGVVTLAANMIIVIANRKSQMRAHDFERGGNSYTSRSDKFKIREPAKKIL